MEHHPAGRPSDPQVASAEAYWRKHPGTPKREGQVFRTLTADQLKSFDRDGFLLIKAKDAWTPGELKLLLDSVNLMGEWKDHAGKYMKYYEPDKRDASAPKLLCRIENFTQFNPGLDYVLNGHKLVKMCDDLFNEPAILYKEKINYKLPGGDGFTPHQDVAAGWWMYKQTLHISCLVSIDAATEANGCLEVVRGHHLDGMMGDDWKAIPDEKVAGMKWELIPTEPGDVMFFDSYVPHRSAPNFTNHSRRVLYATYAKGSEGDYRDRYYADKRASFPPDIERDPSKKYEYKI